MTPNAGLAGARSSCRRSIRLTRALALGLLLTGAAARAEDAGGRSAGPSAGDSSLDRTVALIEGAFRTGRPDPLMSLLPGDARTLVLLRSAGCAAGYYSRDQVYFILSAMFTRRETVHFKLRPRKPLRERDASGPPADAEAPVSCVATWTYRSRDGADGETQVHFVLFSRKGSWSLAEIREAQ